MNAQMEAFNGALTGLLARMDAAKAGQADADALRTQVLALQTELNEANAWLVEATAKMDAS